MRKGVVIFVLAIMIFSFVNADELRFSGAVLQVFSSEWYDEIESSLTATEENLVRCRAFLEFPDGFFDDKSAGDYAVSCSFELSKDGEHYETFKEEQKPIEKELSQVRTLCFVRNDENTGRCDFLQWADGMRGKFVRCALTLKKIRGDKPLSIIDRKNTSRFAIERPLLYKDKGSMEFNNLQDEKGKSFWEYMRDRQTGWTGSVSYTHLTLPTN